MTKVAVLVGSKGRGSNMAALIAACKSGYVPAEVVLVASEAAESPALRRAEALGAQTLALPVENLAAELHARAIDWLCLAGFMRLLPADVIKAMNGRVLNIHPALLPKFGGKGMYGLAVHRAVLESGDAESGCTVHFVDEEYDCGRTLLQKRCPVLAGDTPEALAERVLDLEHLAYPEALRRAILDEQS